jgi:hypothetical protein
MHIDNKGLCKIVITTLIILMLVTNLITYSVTKKSSYQRGLIVGLITGWKTCEIKDPNTTFLQNTSAMLEMSYKINDLK